MGFMIEMNWVLKLRTEQGLDEDNLEEGQTYGFEKDGNRIYPLGFPIDLVNGDWKAVGRVIIVEFTNSEEKTKGIYKVKSIFDDGERESVTQYLGKQ